MPKKSTSHDTYLHELCYFSIMSLSSHIYFLTRKQKKKIDLACSRTARVIVKFETHARLPMARAGYSPARTSSARWERVPSHPVLVVVHHEGADKFSLRSTFARSFASSVGMRAIIIWAVWCARPNDEAMSSCFLFSINRLRSCESGSVVIVLWGVRDRTSDFVCDFTCFKWSVCHGRCFTFNC